MRSCDAAQERLALLAAGEIDPTERRSLDAHLDGCADCAAMAASLVETMAAIRNDAAPDPGPLYWASFQDRLEARIAGRQRTARQRSSLAVAAVVVLAVALGILTRGRLHPGSSRFDVPESAGGAGSPSEESAEARLEAALSKLAGQDPGSRRFEAILDELLPEEPADLEEGLVPGVPDEGATAASEGPSC